MPTALTISRYRYQSYNTPPIPQIIKPGCPNWTMMPFQEKRVVAGKMFFRSRFVITGLPSRFPQDVTAERVIVSPIILARHFYKLIVHTFFITRFGRVSTYSENFATAELHKCSSESKALIGVGSDAGRKDIISVCGREPAATLTACGNRRPARSQKIPTSHAPSANVYFGCRHLNKAPGILVLRDLQ